MSAVIALAVILLPLGAGLLLALIAFDRRLGRAGPAELGYGILLGLLLATLVLRTLDAMGLSLRAPQFLAAALLLLTVSMAWYRLRTTVEVPLPSNRALAWPARGLLWLFATLILVHLALASTEALVRPLFGWDATMHWATKARVWFEQGSLVPFVHNLDWLDAGAQVYTDHHPDYPPTIPLLQLWTVIALGEWNETVINLPWPLLMLAAALIFYGQGRYLGASRLNAAGFTYLLLSLPLLNTQVALAGYADFPLGVCYLGAALALLRWLDSGSGKQLLLGLVLIVMLTQFKNEGFFWALSLLAVLILTRLPVTTSMGVLVAGTLAVLALLLIMPGDLMIAGHSLDSLQIGYKTGSLGKLLKQFAYGTWHLLGLLMVLTAIGALLLRRISAVAGMLATALCLSLGLYLFLFTFTRFSHGAVYMTAAARIGLHLAPAIVFLGLLVWQRAVDAWSAED